MSTPSRIVLWITLGITVGGWGVTIQHWGDFYATPGPLFGLIMLLASNFAAAYGVKTPGRGEVPPQN